ncbi:MAG: thioesterase family protein, partial [Burkholderiaceae bacterium]|nr:thioesterase family protein [Burkholderiaceae bacterium]
MTTTPHPFDQALVLESTAPGHFRGHTNPAYWNMVGPFGGITAATVLRAILLHPDRLGDPLSLTVNYAGALSTGPFTVQAMPVRTNRSTQHWNVSILQTGVQGEQVVTT